MNDAFARISAGQHAHPPINRERLYKAAYKRVRAPTLAFPEGFRCYECARVEHPAARNARDLVSSFSYRRASSPTEINIHRGLMHTAR